MIYSAISGECRIYISDDDVSFWEENDVSPTIDIDSMRDFVRIFVNGQLAGIWLDLLCAIFIMHSTLCVNVALNPPLAVSSAGIVKVYFNH